MEAYLWRGLLIVGTAVAASAQHTRGEILTLNEATSYVVRAYNEEQSSVFRLLEGGAAPPEWDATAESSQQELKLVIQETVCSPHEKRPLEECDFKEDGVKKFCSEIYVMEQGYHFILAWCGDTEKKPDPLLRSRWTKFRKNLMKRFREAGKDYALAIAVTIA